MRVFQPRKQACPKQRQRDEIVKVSGIFRVVQVCDEERSCGMTCLTAANCQSTRSGKGTPFELRNGTTYSPGRRGLGPED
jgi:hypothetical protein